MFSHDVQERFREFAQQIVAGGFSSSKTWIDNDWRRSATRKGSARTLRYWRRIVAAGGLHPSGRACLDAGCGAGVLTALLSLAGARLVLAVDILPEAVRVTREVVRLGRLPNVEIIEGDAAQLAVARGPFNLIYSAEAISHYRDYRAFLRSAWLLLPVGGILVVSDANNAANPTIVRQAREIWRAFEHGHPAGRCGIHQCTAGGYLGAREAILRAELPYLSVGRVEQYARWTFGYNREQVVNAARMFAAGDLSMKSEFDPDVCPLDPNENMHAEQLFHPYRLAAEMSSMGFRVRVRAHLADRYPLLNAVWGWLSPLTMRHSRGFVVMGQKT